MTWSEWNDDEQGPPAPLPAHERAWRHPSEMGQQAWIHSEPPLAIGRGLTAVTGAIGGLLAMAVLWTMVPTQAGRNVVATVRSTINRGNETGLAAERSTTTRPSTTTKPSTTALPVSVATTTRATADVAPPSTIGLTPRPVATYQLQQSTEVATDAVAVAVNGGGLVITTASAVSNASPDLAVQLVLSDGTVTQARVLLVDDRSGLAVLAPETADGIESFAVATKIAPGDLLTFFGDEQKTVMIGDDNSIDATWAADASIREGTPVVNQRGELVALCSHGDDGGRLVQLGGLDELQQAIAAHTPGAKVWLGITLTTTDKGESAIGALDANGPAAAAGLAVGDVLVSLDDQPLTDGASVAALLAPYEPGDAVRLLVRRADGSEIPFTVTLGDPAANV